MPSINEEMNIVIRAEADQAVEAFNEVMVASNRMKDVVQSTASTAGSSFNTQTSKMTDSSDSLDASIGGLTAGLISLGSAATFALSALKQGISDAEDERRAMVRLQAVIESTGRASEITAGKIDAIASVLEDEAFMDKQAIMDAAGALAVYDSIASSLYERIINASSDLSVVLGSDVGSAISDIGRSLEDPIDGITRLRRQGIFISQDTQNQISALVEQNKIYEAQSIILDEIEAKVGGVAKQMAEVSGGAGLSSAWGKFVGEVGKTIQDSTSEGQRVLSNIFNFFTRNLEEHNLTTAALSMDVEEALKLGTADLADYIDTLKTFTETDWNKLFPSFEDMQNQTLARAIEEAILPALEEELAKRNAITSAEQAAAEEAKRAEEERSAATKSRQEMLDAETAKATELQSLYSSTDEGHIKELQAQIELLTAQAESDIALLNALRHDPEGDAELSAIVQQRIPMYEAVIKGLQEELKGLTEVADETVEESIISKILGMSAEDYSLNIPLSFDFGRTELETIEEQLSTLKSAINSLWRSKPDDESGLAEWEAALNTLSTKYDELENKQSDIVKQQDLKTLAEKELLKLLTDEEAKQKTLEEYQESIKELLDAKVISQEQYNQLLDKEQNSLGLSNNEMSGMQTSMGILNEEWDSFVQSSLSYERIAGVLTDVFVAWGDAWSSNEDQAKAVSDVFGDFAQQITKEMADMFITAGLRCIIEGGWAGLGIGLALIAAGGLTGFASGAMGGSHAALDDSIMDSMQDELAARQKLTETIQSSIDTEYELLKRQLDRNLIDEETFRAGAGSLQGQRNEADARSELSQSVYDKINELNNEYAEMSGWDKFWSGRDEDIEKEIVKLQSLFDSIEGASTDELRTMVETLKNMGVAVGNVPKFATGGEFVTNGPQLIMVGDNPSGREHVQITPLAESGSVTNNNSSTTVIHLNGDIYGIEDLYGKLTEVGVKLDRRKRA